MEWAFIPQTKTITGLSGSAKSLCASSAKNQDKILVMASTYGEAERLVNDFYPGYLMWFIHFGR